jgi:hypothetical protein
VRARRENRRPRQQQQQQRRQRRRRRRPTDQERKWQPITAPTRHCELAAALFWSLLAAALLLSSLGAFSQDQRARSRRSLYSRHFQVPPQDRRPARPARSARLGADTGSGSSGCAGTVCCLRDTDASIGPTEPCSRATGRNRLARTPVQEINEFSIDLVRQQALNVNPAGARRVSRRPLPRNRPQ